MKKNCLIILESTVETGTTRNYLVKLLEDNPQKISFDVAFSPERIDPGNNNWSLKNTPKIVSGLTDASTKRAIEFYSKFVDDLVVCESIEIAETAKLLENTFRFINISFINEFSVFCNKMGLDVNQVISAAATKPYGFMPFYPGVGVGGHCIPVDPLYLSNKAKDIGAPTEFIKLAAKVNKQTPHNFVIRAQNILGNLRGKKIIVIGVSYKSNVADVRETPVKSLISELRRHGAEVFWNDDLVKEWNGERSSPLSSQYDLAIVATAHDNLNLNLIRGIPVVNTKGSI